MSLEKDHNWVKMKSVIGLKMNADKCSKCWLIKAKGKNGYNYIFSGGLTAEKQRPECVGIRRNDVIN